MRKHHSGHKDVWPLSHLFEIIVNITSWWHPPMRKHLKIIIWARSWPWPNRRMPHLPSHSMPCCVTSTQSRGLVAIPGGGFNEKSQGLWCIWYTGSFVSWKTKTDFKVLLPWSKKTSVRLSQTACATTTDQPYIVEQSTFSRPPNSITAFWITIYLDGS